MAGAQELAVVAQLLLLALLMWAGIRLGTLVADQHLHVGPLAVGSVSQTPWRSESSTLVLVVGWSCLVAALPAGKRTGPQRLSGWQP